MWIIRPMWVITLRKVSTNTVDISTNKYTPKNVRGTIVEFWTTEITIKKAHGNNVDFLTTKITSKSTTLKQHAFFEHQNYIEKQYVETKWIFRPSKLR